MTTTTTAPPTDRPASTSAGRTDPPRCDPHTSGEELPRWQHGRVAWFNTEKGFGFLTPDTGPAVFLDYQAIDVPGCKTLVAGQPVVFTAADTGRGPQATRVVPYTRAHTTPRIPPRPS
ncbi:cold shock domain-containing protein [Nocardia jiangxiensis]|uniref:cold shock domain-containing protein n=1 Tax=Nocardia jiangxiensis TaxID=282685 RepID=UPI000A036BA4|nr:cold shock domain-containing protein [Nocardia jiangxiensis]